MASPLIVSLPVCEADLCPLIGRAIVARRSRRTFVDVPAFALSKRTRVIDNDHYGNGKWFRCFHFSPLLIRDNMLNGRSDTGVGMPEIISQYSALKNERTDQFNLMKDDTKFKT
jgi:hypothetical protein